METVSLYTFELVIRNKQKNDWDCINIFPFLQFFTLFLDLISITVYKLFLNKSTSEILRICISQQLLFKLNLKKYFNTYN